jgi:uncharacterized protein
VAGAVLLLGLPPSAFAAIVPVLIGLGCLLVIIQPWLSRWLAERRGVENEAHLGSGSGWLWLGILLTGIYGGYFGAAQGVLLLALMGIGLTETLNRINAVKNMLALIVNGVAGVVFAILPLTPWAQPGAEVDWLVALTIAIGSVLGAQLGGRVGRRLPAMVYRVVIVVVGVAAIVSLVW